MCPPTPHFAWKILFLIALQQLLTQAQRVYVDEWNGIDSLDCIYGLTSCLTLDYAVNNTGNMTLIILKSDITVDTTIKVSYRSEITILGNNTTVIQCNCLESKRGHCGIIFINSKNITLRGFVMDSCSASAKIQLISDSTTKLLTGLHFFSCENVNMNIISIVKSTGFGVSLVNCHGEIEINKSCFLDNSVDPDGSYYGGGGMLILFDLSIRGKKNDTNGSYSIANSVFQNNTLTLPKNCTHYYHRSYGGGLNVLLSQKAAGKSIFISGCNFTNNTSLGGGGLAVSLRYGASDNKVCIKECHFCDNNGSYDGRGGGGGLKITVDSSSKNSLNISDCVFLRNTARYGGGVSVMAGSSTEVTNHIHFLICKWKNNSASISGAVDLSPSFRSQDRHMFNALVCFENSHIVGNFLAPYGQTMGEGVFLVTRLQVKFMGNITFEDNKNTALFIHSSFIDITSSSTMTFVNNNGSAGGAIKMIGFSGIHYEDNTTFVFHNNRANFLGGAIFSKNSDQHLSFSSHTCLFKPKSNNPENVHFNFTNNTAGTHYGLSIYLTSINACKKICNEKINTTVDDPFNNNTNCLGNFTFTNKADDHGRIVTTEINKIFINSSDNVLYVNQSLKMVPVLQVIPGRPTYIALVTHDDFNHKTTSITAFYANLVNADDGLHIKKSTRIVNNNHVIINGHPGKRGSLLLSTIADRGAFITLQFQMIQCPPGFTLMNKTCKCDFIQYVGISGCDAVSGLLLPGYWAGYIHQENKDRSEYRLYNSDCPLSYCKPFVNINTSAFGGRFLRLTSTASKMDMEKLICEENRYGVLCGRCNNGTSVFYHSNSFQCRKEKYCKYGLLFYVLVDLVPIGILFGVLLIFDISLTSGTAYSVIFMIQQIHALEITARGAIVFEKHYIIETVSVIYSLFNLEFLNMESLSFCIWSNAQTMDVLLMKYFSIIYSMILVLVFVLLMNKCNCHFVKRLCKRTKSGRLYSIAQGLTAFLVVCYTQITRVTFNILSKGVMYGVGTKHYRDVAFFDGESRYFRGRHLYYSIPALLFLFFIVIPPPLILIFDPIFLKLEDMLWHRVRRQPWTVIRIKIKPILDSFQNCFKGNMQWFAGLFFLYRFMILSMLMATTNTLQYYNMVEGLLIIFLTLHAMIQPFAEVKHNILASLCLCNLVLVNYLTLRIYNLVTTVGYGTEIRVYQWIQLCLIYMPIVVCMIWIARHIVNWCLRRVFKRQYLFWTRLDLSEEDDYIDTMFNRTVTDYNSFEED